jgi:hypothetical protein
VEEIGGEHRRGLGVQELAPRRVGVALRRRGNPLGLQDPADRGGADPVAELEQLALDPPDPQLLFSVARRSMSAAVSALTGGRPRAVRVGLLLCDQAAVPAQDGAGRDQPVRPQLMWQEAD